MGKVISLISLKGGVGKTTLSASLAVDLAKNYGKKVLLIDANYSAPNLGLHMDIISPGKTVHDVLSSTRTRMSGAIHKKYDVDVVPGNFLYNQEYNSLKLRSKLAQIKRNYDFVVIDSSPSLNDEILSAMLASDSLFLVSTADYPTLSCSMKLAKIARQRGKELSGVIVNRILKGNFQIGLGEIQESVGVPVVAMIKEDKRVAKSLYSRTPMSLYSRKSQFSKEINKLSSALVGLKEKRNGIRKLFGKKPVREEVNREVLRESFYKSIFK